MLIPRALTPHLLEQLREELARDHERLLYFRVGRGVPWLPGETAADPMSDWNSAERLSAVREDGRLVVRGYLSADVDLETNTVVALAAISARPHSVVFMRDLGRFIDELVQAHCLLRFCCLVGNPAMRIWRRAAVSRGGGQVGYQRQAARLANGRVVDRVIFEIPGAGRSPDPLVAPLR